MILLSNASYTHLCSANLGAPLLNFLFIKMQEGEPDVVTLFTPLKEQTM
jgi:hypothetical protein